MTAAASIPSPRTRAQDHIMAHTNAVLKAPSGQVAKPALKALVDSFDPQTGVHRGLIALGALVVLPTHCLPEIVTAIAEALKRLGRQDEAHTMGQQRARLGSRPQRAGTLACLIDYCLRLNVPELTAGMQVAQAFYPQTSTAAVLPKMEVAAQANAGRYIRRHLPGLQKVLASSVGTSIEDTRLRLGLETSQRLKAYPLQSEPPAVRVLTFRPVAARSSLVAQLPLWHDGAAFPALHASLLWHRDTAVSQRATRHFIDQQGPESVLILLERLLQCRWPRDEQLALALSSALVALNADGGLLALAASMLVSKHTFPLVLRALSTAPIHSAKLQASLGWLSRRLDEQHPVQREVRLAFAMLTRFDDHDVRTGIVVAASLRPYVAWADVTLPLHLVDDKTALDHANGRLPYLVDLLCSSLQRDG
jgi:hypothetical protein